MNNKKYYVIKQNWKNKIECVMCGTVKDLIQYQLECGTEKENLIYYNSFEKAMENNFFGDELYKLVSKKDYEIIDNYFTTEEEKIKIWNKYSL